MTELAKSTQGGLTVKLVSEMTGYAPAEIALVARTVAVGAPLQELAVFLHSCRSLGLDPLLRQAYWIRRKGKGALQVGIDGFRAIAESSGTYAGAEAIEYRGGIEWVYKGQKVIVPELARATVWKIVGGHKSAFVGEAYWTEFVPSGTDEGFMWARMPRHMLGKCAESQALRRAFPAQLGALALGDQAEQDAYVAGSKSPQEARQPLSQAELAHRHAQIYDDAYDLPEPKEGKALAEGASDDDNPEAEVSADDDE